MKDTSSMNTNRHQFQMSTLMKVLKNKLSIHTNIATYCDLLICFVWYFEKWDLKTSCTDSNFEYNCFRSEHILVSTFSNEYLPIHETKQSNFAFLHVKIQYHQILENWSWFYQQSKINLKVNLLATMSEWSISFKYNQHLIIHWWSQWTCRLWYSFMKQNSLYSNPFELLA